MSQSGGPIKQSTVIAVITQLHFNFLFLVDFCVFRSLLPKALSFPLHRHTVLFSFLVLCFSSLYYPSHSPFLTSFLASWYFIFLVHLFPSVFPRIVISALRYPLFNPLQSLTCARSQGVNSWYVTLTRIALHSCNVPIVGWHSAKPAMLPWRFVTSLGQSKPVHRVHVAFVACFAKKHSQWYTRICTFK